MGIRDTGVRLHLVSGSGFELVVSGGRPVRYSSHTHVSTYTLLLVRRGCVDLTLAGDAIPLRRGDATLIAPHRPHSLRAGASHELATISINPPFRADHAFQKRLDAFLDALVCRDLLRPRERKTVRAHLRAMSALPLDDKEPLARLRANLESHPEREMTLADMASFAHIDRHHLIRVFKRRYGLTPRVFLNQNRVRKARRELIHSGSLTMAAQSAGFYDQSHFIRHFKRIHGVSPGQYLRSTEYLD